MTGSPQGRRAGVATLLVVVGAAVAAAAWLGGGGPGPVVAVPVAFAAAAAAIYVWSGRSDDDVPAILGGVGDERQRLMDIRAMAVAGLVMGLFCTALALVSLARADDNPWLVVTLVGAVSYVAALAVLKVRG